jgi:hypothetical protein
VEDEETEEDEEREAAAEEEDEEADDGWMVNAANVCWMRSRACSVMLICMGAPMTTKRVLIHTAFCNAVGVGPSSLRKEAKEAEEGEAGDELKAEDEMRLYC